MAKTPAQTVKDKYGDKSKLVAALKPFLGDDLWVARENKDKGLAHVSNAKLLRLLGIFSAVQSKWGTRAKLIDAIMGVEGRAKDTGYRGRLEAWPVPRLYDYYKSAAHRRGLGDEAPKKEAAAPAKAAAAAPKEKAAKKPAAKKAAVEGEAPAKKPAKKKAEKAE
jgi:hypothetical protein